jgi:squalene-hopene/tetraprenyl-beta-curcumene cyclase
MASDPFSGVVCSLALLLAASAGAGAPTQPAHPELLPATGSWADTAKEPLLKEFSVAKAAEFLDRRAHLAEKNCFACHATFSYLPARSAIDPQAKGVLEIRAALEKSVGDFIDKPVPPKLGQSPRAMHILAALQLAQHDAATSGHLQTLTRKALDHAWDYQLENGGWDWVKASEPPSAVDDFYGAAIVAIGVGAAPDGYAATPRAQAGLAKLRDYFRKHPPGDLHQRALLLLADQSIRGLLADGERKKSIDDCFSRQLPDSGWSTASLADWKRPDKEPLDASSSDGLATGFMTYALRKGGGVGVDDPRLRRAVQWLKTHQRETGGWYTRSPREKDLLASYAGTSWAILALAACGEITAPARDSSAVTPVPASGTVVPSR